MRSHCQCTILLQWANVFGVSAAFDGSAPFLSLLIIYFFVQRSWMVLDDKYTWSGYLRWLKELSEDPVSGKVERLEGMMIHIFYDHSCSLLSTLLSFFPVNQFSLHLSVTLFNQIVNHDIAIGSATAITTMSLILLYCLPLPTG